MNATVPQTETTRRLFTPEEANRTLPLVKVIVHDIVALYREIRERRERLTAVTGRAGSSGTREDMYSEEVEQMEASIYADIEKLQEFIEELHRLGIELKDPEVGSVDFPAVLDGRDVFLSWHLGESHVSHWHERDTGNETRFPLEQPRA